MNDVEIYVVVEGQTEKVFVIDVLAPYLAYRKIYMHSALIGKPGHKGGDIRFERAKNDIGNFLKQRSDIFVSTMFDYNRIDSEWPGKAEIVRRIGQGAVLSVEQKAKIMESATCDEIAVLFPEINSENRFIPYIQMHEFEALLFSDIDILSEIAGIGCPLLESIRGKRINPEEINDEPANAPCKRLIGLKSDYRKIAMAKFVSGAMGVDKIRMRCSHFNSWLEKLESLSSHTTKSA